MRGLFAERLRPWTILENNINQTACSAGASVSSAGLVAPIPALAMLTGQALRWHYLALWVFSVMLVGITVAVAMRRPMIVVDKLPFASGIACAETLKEIYAHGRQAIARVLLLGGAAVAACAVKIAEHAAGWRAFWPVGGSSNGYRLSALTFGLDPSLLFYGVGGLIGIRTGVSLLIGAILAYAIIAPPMIDQGYLRLLTQQPLATLPEGITFPQPPEGHMSYNTQRARLEWKGIMTAAERDELLALSPDAAYQQAVRTLFVSSQLRLVQIGADDPGFAAAVAQIDPTVDAKAVKPAAPNFTDLVTWLLWPGVTLMVVSALVSFAFSWKAVVRALSGVRGGGAEEDDPGAAASVPGKVFMAALVGVMLLSVVLQVSFFAIFWWAAIIGVLLSFVMALVAGRVSGETMITPVGAMGKVTQLVFGVLVPNNPAPNLMAANVTGGAASQCADLLHDMKCGYLLGASPKFQSYAQVFGAFAGALVGSAVYLILIPNPKEQLLTEEWAAPAVATWKAVAELFMIGFAVLPEGAAWAMLIAAIAGLAFPIAEKVAPKGVRPYIPSVSSIGLAFVVQASASLTMFTGALIGWAVSKVFKNWAARFLVAICAGLIAGDTITGVGLAVYQLIGSAL